MFQNRKDAKEKLAQVLEKYKGENLLFLLFHVGSGGGITGCIETKRGFFPPKKQNLSFSLKRVFYMCLT